MRLSAARLTSPHAVLQSPVSRAVAMVPGSGLTICRRTGNDTASDRAQQAPAGSQRASALAPNDRASQRPADPSGAPRKPQKPAQLRQKPVKYSRLREAMRRASMEEDPEWKDLAARATENSAPRARQAAPIRQPEREPTPEYGMSAMAWKSGPARPQDRQQPPAPRDVHQAPPRDQDAPPRREQDARGASRMRRRPFRRHAGVGRGSIRRT